MRCLQKNPSKRPDIRVLLKDPWLTNNGQDPLQEVCDDQEFTVDEDDLKEALTLLDKV